MGEFRHFAPAVIFAIGALLLAGKRQQEAPAPRATLASIPATLGDFRATDMTLSDDEQRVAGMSDYILRQYTRDSTSTFSIYVGYYASQQQGRTIHSPKNCLPGAGWQALGTGTEAIGIGDRSYPVNRFLLTNGDERALVYYWYQGRGRIAASEYAVKWDLLRDATFRGRSEEALVRIVVPIARDTGIEGVTASAEVERADRLAGDAARSLIPMVSDVLPHWQFGPAANAEPATR